MVAAGRGAGHRPLRDRPGPCLAAPGAQPRNRAARAGRRSGSKSATPAPSNTTAKASGRRCRKRWTSVAPRPRCMPTSPCNRISGPGCGYSSRTGPSSMAGFSRPCELAEEGSLTKGTRSPRGPWAGRRRTARSPARPWRSPNGWATSSFAAQSLSTLSDIALAHRDFDRACSLMDEVMALLPALHNPDASSTALHVRGLRVSALRQPRRGGGGQRAGHRGRSRPDPASPPACGVLADPAGERDRALGRSTSHGGRGRAGGGRQPGRGHALRLDRLHPPELCYRQRACGR